MFTTLRASAHNIPLPDESVHLIVTSPPYYALRAYSGEQMVEFPTVVYSPMAGMPAIEIHGCDLNCRHVWGETKIVHQRGVSTVSTLDGNQNRGRQEKASNGQHCQLCGGWRGGLGQEPTVEAYIGHLILCLREWRRILRNDGTAWINLGDSYSGSGKGGQSAEKRSDNWQPEYGKPTKANGIPAKNLLLVPERFRLAAQADGWIVRSAFPWIKKNSLPESCLDRPSNSAESWVMLAKSPRYYWDAEAIKAEAAQSSIDRINQPNFDNQTGGEKDYGNGTNPNRSARKTLENFAKNPGRNRRTGDWMFETLDAAIADTRRWLAHAEHVKANQGLLLDTDGDPLAMLVNPRPFPGAHFAAYPPGVVEPLILGGTSQRGVCGKCGNPYKRVTEKAEQVQAHWAPGTQEKAIIAKGKHGVTSVISTGSYQTYTTTGWEPSCACVGAEIVPATVLDPFVGSGTTLEVATSLGRHSIGIDISQEYLDNVLPTRFTDGVQIGMQF